MVDAERCTLYLYDEERRELWTKSTVDEVGANDVIIRVPLDRNALACASARERKLLNIRDAYADERFDRSWDQKHGFRSRQIVCLPVVSTEGGELIGVLQAVNKAAGGRAAAFSTRDEDVLRMVASHIAIFIATVDAS